MSNVNLPEAATIIYQRALALFQANQHAAADKVLEQLFLTHPKNIEGLLLRGIIAYQAGQLSKAKKTYQSVQKIKPNYPLSYYNLAFVYLAEQQYELAIKSILTAIKYDPKNTDFKITLASIYLTQQNYPKAKKTILAFDGWQKIEKAREILAICYQCLGDLENAEKHYMHIYTANPNNQNVLNNLGKLKAERGELSTAEQVLKEAVKLPGNQANAYNNLGNVKLLSNQRPLAIEYFRQALDHQPDLLTASINLGLTYLVEGAIQDAIVVLLPIAQSNLENSYLKGKAVIGVMLAYAHFCEFDKMAQLSEAFQATLEECRSPESSLTISPFQSYMLDCELPDIELFTKKFIESFTSDGIIPNYPVHQRVRVGYLSGDFQDHAVGLLLKDLFEHHSKDQFEIFAFSYTSVEDDWIGKKIAEQADHFVDLSHCQDTKQIVNTIRGYKIDLLVDLSGFTERSKPHVLCHKLAPKMAHWLGYPGTLSMPAMDYYISHPVHINAKHAQNFSEKIVYLPKSLIAVNPQQQECDLTRSDVGLANEQFVFCCFSRSYRFNEDLLDDWAKILQSVPHGVLWLQGGSAILEKNLHDWFEQQGIDKHRIIFSRESRLSKSWQHSLADLWLDPYVMSSGTSLVLALQAGLPVLSLLGQKPQARMGATILAGAYCSQMIMTSREDYCTQAIALATDPVTYNNFKEAMLTQKEVSTLFSPEEFAQDLEKIYLSMVE